MHLAELFNQSSAMLRFGSPASWLWLGLLPVLAVLLAWMARRSLQALHQLRRKAAITLRLGVFLLLLLALAGVQWQINARTVDVIVLNDLSASTVHAVTTDGMTTQQAVQRWLGNAAAGRDKQAGDRIGVVGFAAQPLVDLLPSTQLDLTARPSRDTLNIGSTDIQAAIQLGLAMFHGDAMQRLVLISDGNSNQGDLEAAIQTATAHRIPIDVLPLHYAISNDVVLERVAAPAWQRQGEPFSLDVIIRNLNSAAVSGRLSIEQAGQSVDLDPAKAGVQPTLGITLEPGLNSYRLSVPAGESAGIVRFDARFQADDEQYNAVAGNDAAQAFTVVRGQGKVLWVDNAQEPNISAVVQLLRQQGIAITTMSVRDFPGSLAALQPFDAIVLDNIPRGVDGLSEQSAQDVAQYVHDLGGGLVVLGGPQALGAGGWIGSTLEKVLPISCDVPARQVLARAGLVIVLDSSGSMNSPAGDGRSSKQRLANEAAALAIEALSTQDHIGVVAFNQRPTWIVPLSLNDHTSNATAAVRAIRPEGGTEIFPALRLAAEALMQTSDQLDGLRHILLLTDGQSPEPADAPQLLATMRNQRITLSTVAVGPDADTKLLEKLAQQGGGTYYAVQDLTQLVQIFIRETRILRRSFIQEKEIAPLRTAAADVWPMTLGLDNLPPLTGMVLSRAKSDPKSVVLLQAPGADPLLAYGQAGLGRAAVFTSDSGKRWATAWLSGPSASFWEQLVRSVVRSAAPADVDAQMIVRDGVGQIIVQASSADGQANSFAAVRAALVRPGQTAGQNQTLDLALVQTAPGRYETTFDAAQPGGYIAALQYIDPHGNTSLLYSATAVNGSAELRDLTSNDAALEQIAQRSGGRLLSFDADSPELFTRDGLPAMHRLTLLRNWLLGAAAVFFLVDVANRRIAWDEKSFRRSWDKTISWIGSFFLVHRPDSQPALEQLKKAKADHSVPERLVGPSGSSRLSATQAQPARESKTGAPPLAAGRPLAGAYDAVPANVTTDPRHHEGLSEKGPMTESIDPSTPAGGSSPDSGQMMNELMAAKRRAQQKMRPGDEKD